MKEKRHLHENITRPLGASRQAGRVGLGWRSGGSHGTPYRAGHGCPEAGAAYLEVQDQGNRDGHQQPDHTLPTFHAETKDQHMGANLAARTFLQSSF
eukprot:1167005-Pleurochrysis_carterae.AAC.5